MRDILFRGKTTKDGRWVYGSYLCPSHHWHKFGIHRSWIIDAFANGGYLALAERYAVVDETVGQFTGFIDKNGTMIFEGDFVLAEKDGELQFKGAIVWGHGSFEIREETGQDGYCMCLAYCDGLVLKVVGNMWDTPQQME